MVGVEEKYSAMKYIELYYKANPRMHPTYIDGIYICGVSYDTTTMDNVEVIKVVVIHV
jgi:hypothetical protein